MAKGFFRELKHYKLNDISIELDIETEEAKRLVGILKKYGIVKAVKASKPEYEDLSNQDSHKAFCFFCFNIQLYRNII